MPLLTATITAGNQRTAYAYGPDAERVLTHTINTATGTLTSSTLTLGNLAELTINHATGTTQATRFLTMAGTTVAVRANDATLTWPLGNHQGSIVATVTTAGATQRHLYTPYGAARTTPPATTATRGFLNQPHDTSHQLSHLHHRHYDPHSGIFTTVDPLVTTTATPYLYGDGNPTTLSDPTGLEPGCGATAWSATSCSEAHAAVDAAAANSPPVVRQQRADFFDYTARCSEGGPTFGGVCEARKMLLNGTNFEDIPGHLLGAFDPGWNLFAHPMLVELAAYINTALGRFPKRMFLTISSLSLNSWEEKLLGGACIHDIQIRNHLPGAPNQCGYASRHQSFSPSRLPSREIQRHPIGVRCR